MRPAVFVAMVDPSWLPVALRRGNQDGLGKNGAILGHIESIWGTFGAFLDHLGPSWAILASSCAILGSSWGLFGARRLRLPSFN